jgi:hypothetical protein
LEFGENKINEVLKDFGTIMKDGKDEFLTLGFDLNRQTNDWLKNNY